MVVIPRKVIWSLATAGITVNALIIYEKFAGNVVAPFLYFIRHAGVLAELLWRSKALCFNRVK